MDEAELFAYLQKQKKAVLLDYLRAAFRQMTAKQCRAVFAATISRPVKSTVDGGKLRHEIEQFRRDSLARKYHAPFMMNSKNVMEIPEETEEWCDRWARFVADVCKLTARGDHVQAVACFAMLDELVEAVDRGDEIIFAEEAGSWMIPTDQKAWMKSYLTSLAATATPEAFSAAVLPKIERDSYRSFSDKVHAVAMKAASRQQKAYLRAEVERRQIRTGPKP